MTIGEAMIWLNSQPDTVKGAILGAGVAMIGIIINGMVSHWNTGRQLKHDRQQKEKERSLNLRRDIYLGVFGYISDALHAINNFGDLNLDFAEVVRAWRKEAHFPAKLNLMGKPELIRAMHRFNRAVGDAVINVRTKRHGLIRLQQEREKLTARAKHHSEARDAALEIAKRRALEGSLNEKEHDRLRDIHNAEGLEIAKLAEERDDLIEKLTHEQLELATFAQRETAKVFELVIPIVAAARDELHQEIDMTVYDEILSGVHPTDSHIARLGAMLGASSRALRAEVGGELGS